MSCFLLFVYFVCFCCSRMCKMCTHKLINQLIAMYTYYHCLVKAKCFCMLQCGISSTCVHVLATYSVSLYCSSYFTSAKHYHKPLVPQSPSCAATIQCGLPHLSSEPPGCQWETLCRTCLPSTHTLQHQQTKYRYMYNFRGLGKRARELFPEDTNVLPRWYSSQRQKP